MASANPGSAAVPPPSTAVLRRAIGASAIGNAVEWFDYGIYAYGTVYIANALFPENSTNAVLFTLIGFALSFLIRPLGGIFWGPLGDKIGRKRVLAMTIILMASATFLVGLLPTYASIGIAAPILLYLLRIVQGFSTGGEYGGAATFMAEYAPDRRRGFFGSFLEVGTLAGFNGGALLMLGLITTLGDDAMNSWGWRVPFLVAGPLGLVGMYLRSKMEDTPVFRELEQKTHETEEAAGTKLKEVVTGYMPQLLKLSGLVIALNVVNYTLLSYSPTYLQTTINLDEQGALIVPIIGQLLMMIVSALRRRAVRPGRPQAGVARVAGRPDRARRSRSTCSWARVWSVRSSRSGSSGCCTRRSSPRSRRRSPRCSPPRCGSRRSRSATTWPRRCSAARRRWSTRASSRAPATSCGPPTT